MVSLQKVNIEYKLSLLMGIGALVVSFILGLITGNGIGSVLLKSFVLTMVFTGLGFGSGLILKKFVPEIYSVLNGVSRDQTVESAERNQKTASDISSLEGDAVTAESDSIPGGTAAAMRDVDDGTGTDEKFVPTGKDSYQKLSTAEPATGKLGKHLFEEKKMKYEPKIMAEAIRTMMSRDND